MEFVGFVCGDRRTSSQLQETVNLMDTNGDAKTAKKVKDAVAAVAAASTSRFLEADWSKDVAVICVQEHRLIDGGVFSQKVQWCQRRGWLALIPAASFNASHEKVNEVAILVLDHLDFGVEPMLFFFSPRWTLAASQASA
eukprot:5804123-Pyramimonas_sp.AAC.1